MKASEMRAKALARQAARKPVSVGVFEEVEYFGQRVLPLVRELEAQRQAIAA